jgi:hypothetical protein
VFIYLDESGDLGFDFTRKKTTKKFVITLLICYSESTRREFTKAVRRTLKNKLNRKKKGSRTIMEIKGTDTTIEVKKYFFRHIRNGDWSICTLALNKARVEMHLRTKSGKKKLYNFLSRFLLEKLPLARASRNVDLVVDRCKNKEEVRDFNLYLVNQLEALLPLNTDLNISHLTSQESAGLQAVDLFCWGIFRKYENNDYEWYNVYQDKVSFETEYLR